MAFKKIDHIALVVKDIETAIGTWEKNLGLKADRSRGGEIPALGIRNAFIPVADSREADLELVSPLGDSGPVAKFAAERGEGQFLLSIAVDDLNAAVEHLRGLGVRVGDPANGLAFVSMKSTHGVNLQLVQRA